MTTSSSTSTNVPKITMLKPKTGFIIPKNKLSGSLVPAYKGVKKADGSDVAHEETTKPLQRKTKWGPDLTQDSTVRKGRALAYQTRVEQITQLLESGSLASLSRKEKSSISGVNAPEHDDKLELEKQEAIGEILKINPTYKVPSDYKPLTREASVPLPMKEDVGYNFVRLVFGPSDTQKRVEKETGAVIRVYGTKLKDKKQIKVEVSASDGSEHLTSYSDLQVLVSADSYEKVDAAVALIELIVSSVSGKSSADGPSVHGDETHTVGKSQDTATDPLTSAAMHNQGPEQSARGSVTTPHGNIQPNPNLWPHKGPLTGPGFIQSPNSMPNASNPITVSPSPFYPSNMSLSAPRPDHAPAFGSASLNSNFMPPRPQQSPLQAFSNNFTPMPHHPSGQSNAPSNPTASPFSGHQLPGFPAGNSGVSGPPFSPHQLGPSPGSSTSLPPRPLHGPVSMPSQTQSSASMLVQHFGQVPTSPRNTSLGGSPIPRPVPSAFHPMQPGMPGVGPGGFPSPSFTPVRSMGGPVQQTNSGDFTYQPHRPDMFPRPGSRPDMFPPAPPSIRPAMQAPPPLRPPMGNQMGMQLPPSHSMNPNQIPPSIMNAHMGGARNHNQFPPSGGPPFFNHPGNAASFQQGPHFARPGNPFPPNQGFRNNLYMPPGRPNFRPGGGYQVCDPFSPTSVPVAPPQQRGNVSNVRRQENDPEYEDLMASLLE